MFSSARRVSRGFRPPGLAALLATVLAGLPGPTPAVPVSEQTFTQPLDGPIHISGSFGEYRHFSRYHHGLDYKTFNRTGLPVRTPLTGVIDRVHVASVGYGYGLFLRASDGTRLTFGHLQDFRCDRPELEFFRRAILLMSPSPFLFFDVPPWFSFNAGQCIARSGESGVGAPHLHFEVEQGGVYYDPLSLPGLSIPDDTAPELLGLYMELPEGLVRIPLKRNDSEAVNASPPAQVEHFTPEGEVPVLVPGAGLRFLIGGYDTMAARNRNGLRRFSLEVSGQELFVHDIDRIRMQELASAAQVYSTSRTVVGAEYVYYLYRPGSRGVAVDSEEPAAADGFKRLPVRIVAADASGNSSVLEFSLRLAPASLANATNRQFLESHAEARLRPDIPYSSIGPGAPRQLQASSGGARMSIAFGAGGVQLPGRIRLFALDSLPVQSRGSLTDSPGEPRAFEQHGPAFYLDGQDLYYLQGGVATAVFPDANEGRVALYYYNFTTRSWRVLAIPRLRAGGQLHYRFPVRFTGPIAQFADLSAPRLGNRILWSAASVLDESGHELVREISVSDTGAGLDPRASRMLLDGRELKWEWVDDRSVMRASVPVELVPEQGALLSVQAVDHGGNPSDWYLEWIDASTLLQSDGSDQSP